MTNIYVETKTPNTESVNYTQRHFKTHRIRHECRKRVRNSGEIFSTLHIFTISRHVEIKTILLWVLQTMVNLELWQPS